jgi:DNA-directed RNA polymerase specialized sigma24 family protein
MLALKDPASPEYQRRLESLVKLYWKPVFCVIQHSWTKNVADAKDMTQAFFTEAVLDGSLLKSFTPERGSFRAFLRRAITFFMSQTKRDAGREKRGGKFDFINLETAVEAGMLVEGAHALAADDVFDRAWNRVVLARALDLLRERLIGQGKESTFRLFDRYELDDERQSLKYADIGRDFDMTAAQVKHALNHARAAFRDAVAEVVKDYVEGPDDLNREIDLLFR